MSKYVVGIFDQFRAATNALSRLRDQLQIAEVSLLSIDSANTDISDFLVDEENSIDETGYYQIGSASSALISIHENFHTLPFTDVGSLVVSGPLSDLLEITYANGGEDNLLLSQALNRIGLTDGLNQRYTDLISEGRILLFVRQTQPQDSIVNILQDYGALMTENINFAV